jgi:4'-phosphopantetheinyl transferase
MKWTLVRIVLPLNRCDQGVIVPDVDLTESIHGCSMRLRSGTISTKALCGGRRDIGSDEAHLWWIRTRDSAHNSAWLEDVLDTSELQRARRFMRDSDRRRFVTARACLRSLVGSYQGLDPREVRFSYGQHGKPTVACGSHATDLSFNVSHAQDLILYAFVQGRAVGVDCEYVRHDIEVEKLMPLVFSSRELDAVGKRSSEDSRDTFFRTWVAKEAYVKATGLGLSLDLTKIHIEWHKPELEGTLEVTGKPEERARWSLRMLPAPPGYQASLVVEAGHCDLRRRG